MRWSKPSPPQRTTQGPSSTGRAAALFFLATVGEPLSRPRDDLGSPRQGRLIERLGKHIAPKFVSVRDDPNLTTWGGKPLLGHFAIDDDGVAPEPVSLVQDGVLKAYYMSRIPTARIHKTNGHARGDQASVGNLFVETHTPTPRAALKAKLIELAKEEDLDYGLLVEELDDSAYGRFGGAEGATQVNLPAPVGVTRVYPDGTRSWSATLPSSQPPSGSSKKWWRWG